MKQIRIQLGERSYDIKIANNLLSRVGKELAIYDLSSNCLLVTNPLVYKFYGRQVLDSLAEVGFNTKLALVDDGEEAKSLKWAARLYDQALDAGLDRKSPIIALGGGVVGDLAGFVAATYMRGIPFIQVPTTLLAQVDSSVGGKVAINHPKGKNLIGAFYQPKLVLADLNTLKTLPLRELRSGLAEVIKYGVIWDKNFFAYLETHIEEAIALNEKVLEVIIAKSCAIKAAIVEQDEKENNLRAILNFGHTFAHAYEALTNFSTYRHGEAVAIGMIEAAKFASTKGLTNQELVQRLERLLVAINFELKPKESYLPEEILEVIKFDKKNKAGKIQLILPLELGKVTNFAVDSADLVNFWRN